MLVWQFAGDLKADFMDGLTFWEIGFSFVLFILLILVHLFHSPKYNQEYIYIYLHVTVHLHSFVILANYQIHFPIFWLTADENWFIFKCILSIQCVVFKVTNQLE